MSNAAIRRDLVQAPAITEAWFALAVDAHIAMRAPESAAAYRRVLAMAPEHAPAITNLTALLVHIGDLRGASISGRRASALAPDFSATHGNLALLGAAQHDPAGAIMRLRRAVALSAEDGQSLANLSGLLLRSNDRSAATIAGRRAVAVTPTSPLPLYNAALAMEGTSLATSLYRSVLALDPGHVDALNNLGSHLHRDGHLNRARSSYRRALAVAAGHAGTLRNLGHVDQLLGQASAAMRWLRRAEAVEALDYTLGSSIISLSHYVEDLAPPAVFALHRRWAARLAVAAKPASRFVRNRDAVRRLRIGYVSADLGRHPVGWFLLPALASRDRERTHVTLYANRRDEEGDDLTATLRDTCDRWRLVAALSDDDLLTLIRDDDIDILIDLSGHTVGNRLPVFAARAAPIQATWLGYFGTTGLSEVDWLLSDGYEVRPEDERWFSERVFRLESGRFCYAPPSYMPPPRRSRAADRPITFGSFNHLAKLNDGVVALWSKVLAALPASRLELRAGSLADPDVQRRVRLAFADRGIQGSRIDLFGPTGHPELLDAYRRIDVALDPQPFSGCLTSIEALWMGVPVVAMSGDRPVARQTSAILARAGLDSMIAADEASYVDIAVALAAAAERNQQDREGLRARVAASSLGDAPGFARALEAAHRHMWRAWLRET